MVASRRRPPNSTRVNKKEPHSSNSAETDFLECNAEPRTAMRVCVLALLAPGGRAWRWFKRVQTGGSRRMASQCALGWLPSSLYVGGCSSHARKPRCRRVNAESQPQRPLASATTKWKPLPRSSPSGGSARTLTMSTFDGGRGRRQNARKKAQTLSTNAAWCTLCGRGGVSSQTLPHTHLGWMEKLGRRQDNSNKKMCLQVRERLESEELTAANQSGRPARAQKKRTILGCSTDHISPSFLLAGDDYSSGAPAPPTTPPSILSTLSTHQARKSNRRGAKAKQMTATAAVVAHLIA